MSTLTLEENKTDAPIRTTTKPRSLVIIDFTNVYSFAVRAINAYVKAQGHHTKSLHIGVKEHDLFDLVSEDKLEDIYTHVKDCDVLGLSLLSTHNLKIANQITQYLKPKISAKIIWGGVPIICDPQYYLKFVDYVCVGEGETVMSQFLEKDDTRDIPGLGYKTANGESVINEMAKRIDLSESPVPYFDLENTYVSRDGSNLTSLKDDPFPLHRITKAGYRIFPIRGCPYACTFCANNKLNVIFRGKGALLRSIKNVKIIEELLAAKELIPTMNKVQFHEDDFMARHIREFTELIEVYTGQIDLPFTINSTCEHITEEKLEIINKYKAKLADAKIGLQSASERVNQKVFKRPFRKIWYYEKLPLLASKGIHVTLDMISDNPYETIEDKYEAFLFYHELSRRVREVSTLYDPINVNDHKLMFYPGTKMYDDAVRDGYVGDNYIDEVLLTRKTTRNKFVDFDNESFTLALFRAGLKKNKKAYIAEACFRLFQHKAVFNFMYKFNIFKYMFITMKLPRHIIKNLKRKLYIAKKNREFKLKTA